ncbi:MAG TPA: hypothetical protein DGT23_16845 [Micromonosporaceae bacterium]|nr:hypothetical protein [Micromonosporaceae bacterium]
MRIQKISAFIGITAAVFVLSACGAKPETSPAAQNAPTSPAPTATAKPAGPKVLKVSNVSGFSSFVTNGTGRTIYRFDKDSTNPAKSTCFDACAKTWEPVLAGPNDGFTVEGGGIDQSLIGFIDRPEGRQITLKGWALYYFKDDKTLGQTAGHEQGGVWFAIAPNGGKAKRTAASTAPYSY